MPLDYMVARTFLDREFANIEIQFLEGHYQGIDQPQKIHFDKIFESGTQAFREALLGCMLVRYLDKQIDIHKPYLKQGSDAYSGRTFDERVVNPFLHEKRIPCSKGPFLSVFRRSVPFSNGTGTGIRDAEAFNAFLWLIDSVANETDNETILKSIRYLLSRFLDLRATSEIGLLTLPRISLEQYNEIITKLISTPSGGRFPVLLVKSIFFTIKEVYELGWEIEVTGINEADSASGSNGDITIRQGQNIILSAEITERIVDRNRLISTFTTKIAHQSIENYLFLITSQPSDEVSRQIRQYFSQGYEINVLDMRNWMVMILATLGRKGRERFSQTLIREISSIEIPSPMKMAWNQIITEISTS